MADPIYAVRVPRPVVIRGLISRIKLATRRLSARDGDILQDALTDYCTRVTQKEKGAAAPSSDSVYVRRD